MSSNYQINQSSIIHQNIEGEVVVINLNTGDYYSLVNVGMRIWDLIENSATLNHIVNTLNAEYASNGLDIKAEVSRFIEELHKESLIVPTEGNKFNSSSSTSELTPENKNKEKTTFEKPVLQKFTDMQELLLIDPIHEVDETGWPRTKPKEIK